MVENRVRYRNWSNAHLLAYPRAYGYRRPWNIYTLYVRRTAAQRIAYITYTPDIIILLYIITPPTDIGYVI